MASAKNDSPLKISATGVTQLGIKAHDLATQYTVQLSLRLEPTLLANLSADLVTIGTAVPAAKTAHAGAKQATTAQNTALETAYNSVTAVRTAVARKKPAKDVSQAYAVGLAVNKNVVKAVKSALQMIVTRATDNPAEAGTFGILATDVALYQAQIAAVGAADQAQEKARAAAPLSTKTRNTILRRILDAVDSIAGAGILAFANSPTERASFEALIKKTK